MPTTFPRLMLDHAKARPSAPALREKVCGSWQATTWAELVFNSAALGARLARKLALAPEWDRSTLKNAGEQRKWLDKLKKRLASWEAGKN